MVAAARPVAAAGRPIVIFPQGTRAPSGVRLPYQPGVAALYQALNLPIVPAAVNSGMFWGRRSFIKRPGRITLEFLEPLPPGLPRRRLMAELEARIETATAALEREAEFCPAEAGGSAERGRQADRLNRHRAPLMCPADRRRRRVVPGDDPHPLVELGDDVSRPMAGFEKRHAVFAARGEHAVARLLHLGRIGFAPQRGVAERQPQIARSHFREAEAWDGADRFAVGDALGAFQLHAEQ